MDSKSRSFNLKSHRDKFLFDHLEEVKRHALTLASHNPHIAKNSGLQRILELLSYCHDFGKASQYFQLKLDNRLHKDRLGEHGLISALFGYFLVTQEELEGVNKKFAALAVYNIIKHHHGNLRNLEKRLDTHEYHYLTEILDSILTHKPEVVQIYSTILKDPGTKIDEFRSFLQELLNVSQFRIKGSDLFTMRQRRDKNPNYFYTFNVLYSILLESDKKSASQTAGIESSFVPRESLVQKYKEGFNHHNEFDKVREEIYQEILSNLEVSSKTNTFFQINAPTGSGKTLALLGSAFKLAEKMRELEGRNSRIIYALPFISIIEQNYKVFREVIEKTEESVGNETLLEHHHLADEIFKTNGEEIEYSKSSFLIENWYSKIVVTTFYQLFKSVYTNKNHLLKKCNKLANSIILIDEIQAIPPSLFQAIRDLLKFVAEKLNSYVILATATQPKLNREDEQPEEKLSGTKLFSPINSERLGKTKIDKFFNRYYLNTKLITEELTLEDLLKVLESKIGLRSLMVVMNTISSTKDLYERLTQNENFTDYKKIYLSTNIPPIERFARINRAQKLIKQGGKFILITTQLIEAGVDISVSGIIRDMAPLDKIVQAAGRTNRHNEQDVSEVLVVNLVDGDNQYRAFSSYIYDKLLLAKTKKTLKENGARIEEKDLYSKILPNYFQELINHEAQGIFETKEGNKINLKQEIAGLNFEEVEEYFDLIQDHLPEISCFISQNDNDDELWEKYRQISEMPSDSWDQYLKQQEEFSKIKNSFNRRIVTLKVSSEKEKVDLARKIISFSSGENFRCNNIYRINSDNSALYNEEMGISVKENDRAMII